MNCTEPPLTTVRQPIEAMGRAAVDLLAGLIAGSEVGPDELLFEPELVVRGSTGPAAATLDRAASSAVPRDVYARSLRTGIDFLRIYVRLLQRSAGRTYRRRP